jgi:hypothetical protein
VRIPLKLQCSWKAGDKAIDLDSKEKVILRPEAGWEIKKRITA